MIENSSSPLIKAVVALDAYFSELERIGNKINSLEMKSEFDFAHAQKLMTRFAECGEGVTTEVVNLSNYLNEARHRADALAAGVAERALLLSSRKSTEKEKLDQFRELGERVQVLVAAMNTLRRPENAILTEDDRLQLAKDLAGFERELTPLIEEAQILRKEAHLAKMRTLEQNADSLAQTLLAAREKINSLHVTS